MKITVKVSGVVARRANKKDVLNYGKTYIKPINERGMEELVTFEGDEEKLNKEVGAFLRNCVVKPKSRTQRYLSRSGDKECYFLTLDSYKALAPYLRKFNYIV